MEMKEKVLQFTKKWVAVLSMTMLLGILFTPIAVCAAEAGGGNYDISWLGGEGNGAFDKLETQVQQTGNSAYRLFLSIGVVGLILSIIICGLSIVVSGGGNKRSEKLGWLLWIGIGGIVIFGAMSIVSMLQNIGGSIV